MAYKKRNKKSDPEKDAKKVSNKIIANMKAGKVSEPMALHFLATTGNRPMDKWSWNNRLGCYMFGATDARTFNQWKQAGRKIKKGNKASAYILCPVIVNKTEENEDEETKTVKRIIGFRDQAVFDITQTEGEPVGDEATIKHIETLPLLDVAKKWDINVVASDTAAAGAAGMYYPGRNAITLGVSNVKVWLHELVHKADDMLGNLTESGQQWRSEVVAEIGAATLAHMIGRGDEADEGRCWKYVERYAKKAGLETDKACYDVLNRMVDAVNLVLETADLSGATEEDEREMVPA